MPYDPNSPMGLDALSPTIAAYKQFVERQNNVGDGNIVQFLASRGEPQLAGLIAKKMRVENAAKAQQQLAQQPQAAPPTVADQYAMAEQQQAQQAMMAQMAQAHTAQQAQSAPGLAGMPNPVMDRASFAGGGIVAFNDGGDVRHFDGLNGSQVGAAQPLSWSDEKEQRFQKLRALHESFSPFASLNPFSSSGVAGEGVDMGNTLDLAGAVAQTKGEYNELLALRSAVRKQQQQQAELGRQAQVAAQYGITLPTGAPPTAAAATTPAAPPAAPKRDFSAEKIASEKRKTTAPAAPAAPAKDTTTDLIGERPAAYASKPITSKALDEERALIEEQKKSNKDEGSDVGGRFIKAGFDILGSTDPNALRAIGTAASKNYGEYMSDMHTLKKEHDALRLQEIKLNQAYEQAQRTQDRDDMERADRLLQAYDTKKVELYKLTQQAQENQKNRESAERRTKMTAGANSPLRIIEENRKVLQNVIGNANTILKKYEGYPPSYINTLPEAEQKRILQAQQDRQTAQSQLDQLRIPSGGYSAIPDDE